MKRRYKKLKKNERKYTLGNLQGEGGGRGRERGEGVGPMPNNVVATIDVQFDWNFETFVEFFGSAIVLWYEQATFWFLSFDWLILVEKTKLLGGLPQCASVLLHFFLLALNWISFFSLCFVVVAVWERIFVVILFRLRLNSGVSVGFYMVIVITCFQVWEYSPAGHANKQSWFIVNQWSHW